VRKVLYILAALLVAYGLLTGALYAAMLQSPDDFARTMKHVPWPAFLVLPFKPLWNAARRGDVAVGAVAPDFTLQSPDHKERFQLSSLRGQKPAVLVFGSYT